MPTDVDYLHRLSAAFRQAYENAGLTQTQLASLIGEDQSLISKWSRGTNQPPVRVLPLVDAACGQPLGYVLRLAGLVADSVGTAAAIATDQSLKPENRRALLQVYEGLRRLDQ